MKNLDEIIKSLLESAIRITEKIEENSSIDQTRGRFFCLTNDSDLHLDVN